MPDHPLQRLAELRAAIEGLGARHAAARAARDPVPVALLRDALGRLTAALRRGNYAAFREADRELHSAIMAMAEVPRLPEIWQLVWDGLLGYHRRGFETFTPDARVLLGEHDHLVDTIARGDPVAAEDAARCHIEAGWFRAAQAGTPKPAVGSAPLHRAAAHVNSNLHCTVRLRDLAARVAFTSPSNLSRLFRQHYGMSFQRYLQRLRMQKAADLLRTTQLPVGTIARRVGYRDASRFGEHFHRHFKVAPTRWRKGLAGSGIRPLSSPSSPPAFPRGT